MSFFLTVSSKDGPVIVVVNMFIRSFDDLCSISQELKTQLTFRQEWNDARLAFDDQDGQIKFLALADVMRIWTPDVFFPNEKTGFWHNIMHPNMLIRVYPNGNVLYSTRISLTTTCAMDLKYFPHDAQTCPMRLASYGYTTDDVVFRWKPDGPIQVTTQLNLDGFTLANYSSDYVSQKTNTGEYSALLADFQFERTFPRYHISVYIPCLMFVVLSYLSLWINNQNHRFILSLVTTISLTFFVAIQSDAFPKVSYTKSIDIWTGSCLTFAFGALLLVVLMSQLPDRSVRSESVEDGNDVPLVRKQTSAEGQGRVWLRQVTQRPLLETGVRAGYPLLFAVFALIYWTTQACGNV